MIALNLAAIAEAVGGHLHGAGDLEVTGPVVIDSREVTAGGLFIALPGEHVDGHDFAEQAMAAGAVAVVANRQLAVPSIVVADVLEALGALARHVLSGLDVTVVGITGSQGKTSVKDLVAHILGEFGPTIASLGSFNNELGVPLTVLRADTLTRFLVLEMGARGVGHIDHLCRIAPPHLGVVLNVGQAHVGEFGSADAIAAAKGELIDALESTGIAVLNSDDSRVAAMSERSLAPTLTFGALGSVRLGETLLDSDGHPHFSLTYEGQTVPASVPHIGAHHATNGAAAVATAVAAGVDFETAAGLLSTATGASPSRMQRHERPDGLVVIDDSYNANPDSMAAALRALAVVGADRSVAVLGEMLELGAASREAHLDVGRLAVELGIGRVLVVGSGAAEIAETAGPIAEKVDDVATAIARLSESLQPDQVVLVKASRAGRLERVVEALLAAASDEDAREENVGR